MEYIPPHQQNKKHSQPPSQTPKTDLPPEYLPENPLQDILPPLSEQTAYMRWSTELEQDPRGLTDQKFMERHKARIIDINKFLPMSNITNPYSIKIFRLRRMIIDLAKEAGLQELAEETALDNLADYNTTRGQHGFLQKAMITQRQELDTNQNEKPSSWIDRLRGKNTKNQNIQEGYYDMGGMMP